MNGSDNHNARAAVLAERFEAINADLLAELEPYSPEQWLSRCEDDDCTVAATVSHVAGSYRAISNWARAVAAGEPPPTVTSQMIDDANARHNEKYGQRDKDETLAALRRNAGLALEFIRGLNDEELDRSAYFAQFGREYTTHDLISAVLIDHPRGHLASIRASLAGRKG